MSNVVCLQPLHFPIIDQKEMATLVAGGVPRPGHDHQESLPKSPAGYIYQHRWNKSKFKVKEIHILFMFFLSYAVVRQDVDIMKYYTLISPGNYTFLIIHLLLYISCT